MWLGLALMTLAMPLAALGQHTQKVDHTSYHHNTVKWVIGQVESRFTNGIITAQTTYDATSALPLREYEFGKLINTMTYNSDGTLASVSDGNDSAGFDTTVHLSGWIRGLPSLIVHPATADQPGGSQVSAVIDAAGLIRSVTNEVGAKTCYDYDAMRRLSSIVYPSETQSGVCDASAWNPVTLAFIRVLHDEHGIPAGHWRHSRYEGNKHVNTYFDAMWRPVVVETLDAGNISSTLSHVVTRYDVMGRKNFESYPQRGIGGNYLGVNQGTHTWTDDLERVTRVEIDSEHGRLASTTQYLPGMAKRDTNFRGFSTFIFNHQAIDGPSYDLPLGIDHPEGAFTEIYRDIFGKPTAMVRRDAGSTVSATRRYVYHPSYQTLCKVIEPETGSTVMDFDAAGNLGWSASGLNLPDPASCNFGDAVAQAVGRNYDQRKRLKTLTFPDARGNQEWKYNADGKPWWIQTVNVPGAVHPINQYVYNKRGMVTTETQVLPAWYTYSLGYGFDRNGSLSRINYPSSDFVDFAPNALGQATRATKAGGHAYAYGASYYPNGALAQFTYGNGLVHTMTQNARQLPEFVRSTGVLDYNYHYDANANIGAIFDNVRGVWGHRGMQYDGLDRLTHVGSPTFGNDTHHMYYTYDVLDNLKTWKNPGWTGNFIRDDLYCYDVQNRLQFLRTGAANCSSGSATTAFQYDSRGNVSQKNGQAFDFDYGNRLREVIGVERYRYDAHGRRILAVNFATGNVFSQYGHQGQLLYQKNQRVGSNLGIDHIYLAGSLIAQREVSLATGAETIKYQHTDALGSPVVVTNQAAQPIERVDYEPYGKAINTVASTGNNRPGYTGHVEDRASGLTYMQQRYYDAGVGRFLSVDPVTAYSGDLRFFNRYSYAFNSPYKFTDPDGRCSSFIGGLVGSLPCHLQERNQNPAHVAADAATSRDAYLVAGPMAAPVLGIVGGQVGATSLAATAKTIQAVRSDKGRTVFCLILSCKSVDPARPRDVTGEIKRESQINVVDAIRRRAEQREISQRAQAQPSRSINAPTQSNSPQQGFRVDRVEGRLDSLRLRKEMGAR